MVPAPTTTAWRAGMGARATACTATDTGSTMAACSNDTSSGRRYTMCSGTATRSAKAPARR